MENRIDRTFEKLKREKRKALIGYITAGFPDKRSLSLLIPQMEQAGLDILELGIPFSDPIADGPTIQKTSQQALQAGATLSWVLDTVKHLRRRVHLPIVFMTYCNPIIAMGTTRFFEQARISGIDGVIIPDLIPEESARRFEAPAQKNNIHLIYLVAPTTPGPRMAAIGRRSRGFLYAVSLRGVTGMRKALPSDLPRFLRKVKAASHVPVAVGFGLSTPAHVRQAARHVDGVIVGSALVKAIGVSKNQNFEKAVQFVRSLKNALNGKESHHAS